MADDIIKNRAKLQQKLGALPIVLIEQFANNSKTEVACVLSVQPRNLQEIQRVLISSHDLELKVRCSGRGYSWSPIFSDPGQVLVYTGFFDSEHGTERIRLNQHPDSKELTVTALASVSDGELAKFFLKNNVCLMSGVNLPSIQLGGLVSTASHGVGTDQPSVSDFITSMSYVGWEGKVHTYNEKKNAEMMKALRCSLGLFGVIYEMTFKVQPMTMVENTQSFPTVEKILSTPQALKALIDDKWATEIFWFPFNSMSNIETLKTAFKGSVTPGTYDPSKDQLWVKQMDVVKVPRQSAPTPEAYLLEDVGYFTEDAYVRLLARTLCTYPALTPGYLRAGLELVRINGDKKVTQTITHAIHYNTWDNLCPTTVFAFGFPLNTEEDFCIVTQALNVVINEVKECSYKGEFPLNITMELRIMGHSDSYLNPAKGTGRNLFIELNSIISTAHWKQFCKRIFLKWLKIDGACPRPNWAKEWSYLPDIYPYLRKVYGTDLDKFKEALFSSLGTTNIIFINDALHKLLFGTEDKDSTEEHEEEELEVRVLKDEVEDFKVDQKHEGSWRDFCAATSERLFHLRGKNISRPTAVKHMMFMHGITNELAKGEAQGLFMSEALTQMFFKHDLNSKLLTEDFTLAGEGNRGINNDDL